MIVKFSCSGHLFLALSQPCFVDVLQGHYSLAQLEHAFYYSSENVRVGSVSASERPSEAASASVVVPTRGVDVDYRWNDAMLSSDCHTNFQLYY